MRAVCIALLLLTMAGATMGANLWPRGDTIAFLGPYSGTTDGEGQFFVAIDDPFKFGVGGQLVGFQGEPLAGLHLKVTLEPRFHQPAIRWPGDIGWIWLSAAGYDRVAITARAGELGFTKGRFALSIRSPVTLDVAEACVHGSTRVRLRGISHMGRPGGSLINVRFLVERCVDGVWQPLQQEWVADGATYSDETWFVPGDRAVRREGHHNSDPPDEVPEKCKACVVITEDEHAVEYTFYHSTGEVWRRLGWIRVPKANFLGDCTQACTYVQVRGYTYHCEATGDWSETLTYVFRPEPEPEPEPEEPPFIIVD